MTIRSITIDDLQEIRGREALRLFLWPEWMTLYNSQAKVYGVFDKSIDPVAVFTLYEGKKFGADFAISPPLSPDCGLHLFDRSTKLSSSQTLEKNVHTTIAAFINSLGAAVIDLNLPVGVVDTQPYTWAGFEVTPRYTYLLDLSMEVDDLLSAMSASKRQNIKKGIVDDLQIEVTDDSDMIINLIKKALNTKNEAWHEDVLRRILDSTDLSNNRFAVMAHVEGRPSAVVFVVFDELKAYYLLGGYDRDNSHDGSGSLAMWHAILESKRRRLETFDFLGSMIPEVERYIRGFGGKLSTFYSISKRSVMADIFMRITGRK